MLFILPRHWYLMETGICIEEAQQITVRSRVHDLIYLWERERVFRTCLIETSVVDAPPKLPTCLGDDNRVGQPTWVVDLPDEASIKQLLNLLSGKILLWTAFGASVGPA
jgi:hypothetical protein